MKIIFTAIFATITALILASCEGITASYKGEAIDAEYSSKGGLVVYPKAPAAIQVIEGTK
jgi:hypothetical protein